MKKTLAVALMAVMGSLLWAQDKVKNDYVEGPIKKGITLVDEGKYDLSKTGIEWRKGLDAALNQGKPILLFQLLGNFDDVFC